MIRPMHPARPPLPPGGRFLISLTAAGLAATISLSPGPAEAYVVTVGGVQYDVTTFTGTYADNISKFRTPANGGAMPWWGSEPTADLFAAAVGNTFGEPNSVSGSTLGPIFAVRIEGANIFGRYYGINGSTTTNNYYRSQSEARVWAQVSPQAAPVPAPLPLFGAAVAFGFCRRLRTRIQA